ncbi:MAG: histidine phosphatase family protein [Actinobacteria bacterium]|nr:histidine phosphatase family protein [Actinomycetota bacterium]
MVLIRHGQTAWSAEGRCTGRADIDLTEHGRAQAESLRPRLATRGFELVLVSPARRARQTAELAALNGPYRVEELALEIDYGDFEGMAKQAVRRAHPGWSVWSGPQPHGESIEDVGERADRVLERLAGVAGEVAVVAHGVFLRVLAARWLDQAPTAGRWLADGEASLSALHRDDGQPLIEVWNDRSHLLELGDVTR